MFESRFMAAVRSAFAPAMKTAMWVTKLMLPITLGIACLNYMGVISWLSSWCAPLFAWMGLPAEAGLVFLTGALSNLYTAIAVMATLGFDLRSVSILAVMGLICHNLIIESAIQHRTGASPWKMSMLRVTTAFVAGILLNQLLPVHMNGRLFLPAEDVLPASWGGVFLQWVRTMVPLTLKMVAIIVSLNVVQSLLREYKIMSILTIPLRPFMGLFGLPRSTSFLWIICNLVGLTYGGAALVYEMEHGDVTPTDSRLLNTHVAISHSLLEDTVVFASIGVPVLWLLLPRMLLAIAAVWLLRAVISKFSTLVQHSSAQ